MSGVLGLVLGMPGLFLTCVHYSEFVQFGRDFRKNFEACSARLAATQLHVPRWEASISINIEPLDSDAQARHFQYPTEEIETAIELLQEIQQALQTAQSTSDYSKKACKRQGKQE